ncbi:MULTISPECIES: STAS domain-containing protein [Ramlibacter]|jgi:anti-sigma B factor antagonist|uniref:Anti-sigma factor antagonist n=1 Tax=Ramlibacter pinisoli TaxID=2682844 RepID=A0A6N8IS31_9BURK|nr:MULTISPECIES: STAS domain-containing protein [Ramlibacter]MBA2964419.1 STAS domain-containing protein [Ramlibacter sp. CGMCC 1.13660]MVQ29385.1 anti-sigma factor antagonist [Ramlibacter pinisoli]
MELIDVDRSGAVPVVVPRVRRLDASVAPAFKQAVVQLVGDGDRRLVVDLAGVDFLDSSGLGALVSILKALGSQGSLAVCGARGPVLALFKLTRMDKVFSIHADRAEALARLGA